MSKKQGTRPSVIPFDAEKPTYTDLTVSVTTRFNERLANYAKHYRDETGREPDLGVLFENIINPALTTDDKFKQKEQSGAFNANGNAPAARAPRSSGEPAASGTPPGK